MFNSIKNALAAAAARLAASTVRLRAMMGSINNVFAAVRVRISTLSHPWRLVTVVAVFVIVVLGLVWLFDKILIFLVARSYVEEIADVFDLNKYLAIAIAWAVFAAIIILTRFIFSFSKLRRRAALAGLFVLLIGHSLILWRGTSGEIIGPHGNALKCYVITRDSVIYREHPGIDPQTGRECKPVTPELVEKLRRYERGERPVRITTDQPIFFDSGTGRPIVWFYKTKDGEIELFDLMGFHPDTGEELSPVSKEIVELWKEQQARKSAKPVDPDIYPPFDPGTGQAQIWYYHSANGEYEFFDHPGYEPQTGEPLTIITRDVLNQWRQWKAHNAEQKCYVLTRDGKVTYHEHPGIDPATGRECRPVKPEIVERLQAYAAGKRAQPITDPSPIFFDLRSGEPIVWFYQSTEGIIELYDLMGFEPNTGEELLPVTKEIAEEWKRQSRRGPKVISDPENYGFFDLLNGNARAWYWRDNNGGYQFYDAPGFQPQTGDQLKLVTRDIIEDWKKHISPTHAPQRIDPTKYPFFDPATGAAQVWYWRSTDGRYEFYDAPGFHPQSGEKLALVTRDVIEDWNNGVQPPRVPSPPPRLLPQNIGAQLHQRTADFLDTLYRTVSDPNGDLLAFWSNIYADQVNFFGQSYSRRQVIGELQRNVARWPIEQYSIKPGSLQIDCDEQLLTCRASGFLDFDARSPARNARSWGTASFEYVLKFASVTAAPKITQESGEAKTRNLGSLSDIVPPPSGNQTWNGCPPNWTIQGGVCKPYQGPTANPRPQSDEAIIRGIVGGVLQRMGH